MRREEILAEIAELEKQLKAVNSTASSLKVSINGSFGKLGSKWSKLYSPDLMIAVTITGQLSLLMLIERLERAGIAVISANTDGVVAKFGPDQEADYKRICDRWQADTGFELEYADYAALYSRDVNTYVAVKPDGSVKKKGAFADPEPVGSGWPSPTNEVSKRAVFDLLAKGVPVEETVLGCRDIRQFITVRTVTGGAVDSAGRYLGKAVRWYYGRGAEGAIHYKKNGNRVARSEGAQPLMDLPPDFPGDVDHDWYIREAYEMLADIGWRGERPAPVSSPILSPFF